MARERSAPPIPVSTWTLATGTQPGRRVAVVVASNESDDHSVQAAISTEGYDIVFVEPPANAYSQIKRIVPNVVVVCLEMDDVTGFQVLSMLKLDSATSQIPVVTYTTSREARNIGCDSGYAKRRASRLVATSPTH